MRLRILGVVLGLVAARGLAISLPDAKPCDMKSVAAAPYCDKCGAFVDASTVDAEKKTHKGTDHAVRNVDACSKTEVRCTASGCSMAWTKGATTPACCKEHTTKDEVVRARVGVRCGECKAWAEKASDLKHAKADCKGTASKSCEKSGTAPHVAPA
ncbi:MAG TPA: hypothetical protein VFI25_09730 [Planctomycetota bacterium]|jgi:hypothetical protein|nr:hypothetical protein [Planctomycetota bacterium]